MASPPRAASLARAQPACAPALAPPCRQSKLPAACGQPLSRAERRRKRYAEDPEYRARTLASNHAWDKAHREQLNEWQRCVRNVNPVYREKSCRRLANGRRKAKYGLSPADFERMLIRQNFRCAVCRIRPADTLCVDHCHVTGEVRGLLCRKCNTGLGCFNDSPVLMLKAMAYLFWHAARQIGARLAAGQAFIARLWQRLRPPAAARQWASGAPAPVYLATFAAQCRLRLGGSARPDSGSACASTHYR
jgi:hypothetical protein